MTFCFLEVKVTKISPKLLQRHWSNTWVFLSKFFGRGSLNPSFQVAFFGREMGPLESQGNLGWWIIIPFGQMLGFVLFWSSKPYDFPELLTTVLQIVEVFHFWGIPFQDMYGICTHIWLMFYGKCIVGRYASPMDPKKDSFWWHTCARLTSMHATLVQWSSTTSTGAMGSLVETCTRLEALS